MLLTTKFLRPTADPRSVRRDRLVGLLEPGGQKRLNLVIAPAGFGKTTLVSQWCAGWTGASAWLALDAHDDDPRRFWQYVTGALEHSGMTGLEQVRQQFIHCSLEELEGPITSLLNALAAQQTPWCLVLDDYHFVSDASIHRQFAFFIDYLPPGITLTVTSRTEPPLPLARWRVRQWVEDLMPAMLSFSQGECRDFFRRYMQLDLPDAELETLYQKTEGWVAAMQLSVLSGRKGMGPETRTDLPIRVNERQINDYVLSEVLEQQPPEIIHFLLDTAFCPRLSASLCNDVRGATDSQPMLEQLLRKNLFLIPLDTHNQWFRYHDLFRDALMERAMLQDPGRANCLWSKAVEWLLKNGHVQEGIAQIVRQQDWPWLAKVLSEHGNNLIHGGFHLPVLDWLERLPEDLSQQQPQLMMLRIWALFFANRLERIAPLLAELEDTLDRRVADSHPDAEGALGLQSELSLIRSYLERSRSRDKSATDLTRQVLEEIDHTRIPLKSVTYYGLGLDYYGRGDLTSAQDALNSAIHYGQLEQKASTVLSSGGMLAWIQYHSGDLDAAQATCSQVRQWVDNHYNDPQNPRLISCWQNSALTELYRERNQRELAESCLAPLLDHVRKGTEPGQHVVIQYVRGHLAFSYGQYADAIRYLEDGEDLAIRRKQHIVFEPPSCAALLARCYLASGQTAKAGQWLESLDPDSNSNPLNREQALISAARVMVARGHTQQAIDTLKPLYQDSEQSGRYRHQVEVRVVHASALLAQGDGEQAEKRLAEALSQASRAGFLRLFLEEGPDIQQRLRRMPDFPGSAEWNQRLRDILLSEDNRPKAPETGSQSDAVTRTIAPVGLVEPLSQREREVLGLIHEGLANKEIALRMDVAATTVKAHIRNLYGKLGVGRRTEALAKARELGLLD